MPNEKEIKDFLDEETPDFEKSEDTLIDDVTKESKETEGTEGTEEGKTEAVPFHKDPKIQKYVDRQIAKAIESIPKTKEVQKSNEDEDDYYARLIGNDTSEKIAMIKEAKARDESLLKQAEERAWNRLTETQRQEAEEEKKAIEMLDSSLENIEQQYSVDITSNTPVSRKLRTDFLKFAEKLAPKDSEGNIVDYPDMSTAFEIFNEKNAKNQDKAKDLASRSMSRSSEVKQPQEKITFDNMDNFFDRMFSKN